jgi:hypothetical protein
MYKPQKENQEWLNWLLDKVQALPYKASARWAFYRVVQEYGFDKSDYHNKFLKITSKVRKEHWNGWDQQTFEDDTRTMSNTYGQAYDDAETWFTSMKDRSPRLTFEYDQENLVFVAYEAKAMSNQFEHYLGKYRICLVPFGGDASVYYKARIAKDMDDAHEKFGKHIVLLYFGDKDKKGDEIPENALRDLRKWTKYDFEYHRLGINPEHISKYNIPVDPETGSKYQWEALDDNIAKELLDQVFDYWSKDVIADIKKKEAKASDIWYRSVDEAIKNAKDLL